jgi:hypothetical protein
VCGIGSGVGAKAIAVRLAGWAHARARDALRASTAFYAAGAAMAGIRLRIDAAATALGLCLAAGFDANPRRTDLSCLTADVAPATMDGVRPQIDAVSATTC